MLSNSEPKQLRHGALLRLCVLILARPRREFTPLWSGLRSFQRIINYNIQSSKENTNKLKILIRHAIKYEFFNICA